MWPIIERIKRPSGNDWAFVTIGTKEMGYKQFPLPHYTTGIVYYFRRPFQGIGLDELLAYKALKKFPIAFADAKCTLPQSQFIFADRVRGRE